jgi:lambda repressor-like predicted transcriptional regulator
MEAAANIHPINEPVWKKFQSDLDREILIKSAFLRRGISGASIARANGLTRHAVNKTVQGVHRGERIRRLIAQAIGMEYSELWGD